ncbi:hypothetical protein [Streptomyces sp. NPDC057579]|uniref:hypothetical protein n=1 Tax=Streptomyces sp. NPDC057579 TaxID=3346172 RepID=UPI0036B79F8E
MSSSSSTSVTLGVDTHADVHAAAAAAAALTSPEARHLLRSIVGSRIDEEPEAAARLAARCAHLPLALRIVAERLATHTHRRVADVVEELDDALLDALADPDDPQLSIRPILDSSYQALPDDQAGAFRLLGLYPQRSSAPLRPAPC